MSHFRPRPLVAGNWKMNGLKFSANTLGEIARGFDAGLWSKVDLLVCPPATLLHTFSVLAVGSRIAIGAQDVHANASGAHTGDLSAELLADSGATYAIVGHSERRADHGESDSDVSTKARAAWRAGLVAIVCVGETRAEREAGKTLSVVKRQIRRSIPSNANPANLVIAYEPVWAIGTGLTPTATDVAEVHALIRAEIARIVGKQAAGMVRILYGGSVKPSNARELLGVANVDGALIGGASLVASDFLAIAEVYRG